jgi:hypothetical protein
MDRRRNRAPYLITHLAAICNSPRKARFTVCAPPLGGANFDAEKYISAPGEIKISTTAVPVQSRQDHKKYILVALSFAGKSD